ncbi:MAG: hypothetical protein KJ064_27475 [Anaerolineae bacterium]|nr:hypothetical protein [Anaerolineae bacterium]
MQAKYDAVVKLTDTVCKKHLNEEYAALCRQMAAKLARKRPSPLESGRAGTWAAAITYAIGQVNFLFDKSQTPHMTSADLAEAFEVSQSTASSKAKTVRDLLNIHLMDPDWTLPSRIDDNLMAWMISVNGFIIDARHTPREVQEIAFAKGLIPYLPQEKDRGKS